MNGLWRWCVVLAIMAGIVTTRSEDMATALLTTGEEALRLTMTLTAAMTLWGGMLEILRASGDLARLGKWLRRWLQPVFRQGPDEACWEAMSANLAANLLGLGNAATPAGIRAAQLLAQRGDQGLYALAALLVINNAGVQLLPTTVITLRQAAGSLQAGDIWLPAAAASLVSALVGVAVLQLLTGRGRHAG